MIEILANEPTVRLICFATVLAVMGIWEQVAPRRQRYFARADRWSVNVALALASTVLVRTGVPVAAVGVATWSHEAGLGLLHLLDLPALPRFVIAIVMLDCAIYWQHRVFHRLPWLWRLHRIHHADLELDVTTGIRFHPLEIVLSALIKVAIVVLMGAPAAAVVAFEVLLNATSMFNHANIRLPALADRVVRQILVTPDMHRVHHSVHEAETNSNFGFNLTWWDHLFGSYTNQPRDGHATMQLGLHAFRERANQRFGALLMQPWQRRP
jgi:sterol desaturase/sphingolipid hydroxylase (fatty acid hydroxylase superfamily)